MSSDPAPKPGVSGQQQQPPGEAEKATGQNTGAAAQNGGNGIAEEVNNLLDADPPSWPWILVAFGILVMAPPSAMWFGDRSNRPTSCRLPTTLSIPACLSWRRP